MRIRTSAMFVALWLAFVGAASAQVANTGTVQVVVEDADGGRLPGVTVTAESADTITKRTAVTDAQGVATLEALQPSRPVRHQRLAVGLRRSDAQPHPGACRTDHDAALHTDAGGGDRSGHRDGRDAAGGRHERDHRPGHHAAADRIAADGPRTRATCSWCPACCPTTRAQSGNPSSRSGMNWKDSDHGGNVGVSDRQLLLLRRHQRDRPGHRHLRRQPEHRNHPGTEGHHGRHPGGVRRRVRSDLDRHHQVGQQQLLGLGELLLPEQQPGRREQARRRHRSSSTKDTAFTLGGPIVKDKLWAFGSYRYTNRAGRRRAGHPRVPPHGRHDPAPGLLQGQLGAPTQNDMLSFTVPERPDGHHGPQPSATSRTAATAPASRAATTTRHLQPHLRGSLLETALNKHNAEVTDISAIRDVAQHGGVPAHDDPHAGGRAARRLRSGPDRPARQQAVPGSAQHTFGDHTAQGRLRVGQHKDNSATLLYVPRVGTRSLAVDLAGTRHHGREHREQHAGSTASST